MSDQDLLYVVIRRYGCPKSSTAIGVYQTWALAKAAADEDWREISKGTGQKELPMEHSQANTNPSSPYYQIESFFLNDAPE